MVWETVQKKPRLERPITSTDGGVWWVVSASAGQIVVIGNEASQVLPCPLLLSSTVHLLCSLLDLVFSSARIVVT